MLLNTAHFLNLCAIKISKLYILTTLNVTFPLIRLHLSGIFMKIISVRQRLYPALLLPLTFSPVLQAASAPNEQTMIVTATPQTVSELDTPAAVSVIEEKTCVWRRRALIYLRL